MVLKEGREREGKEGVLRKGKGSEEKGNKWC